MNVFRDRLQEHRGDYYVEYQPATEALGIATISVVFPNQGVKPSIVAAAMKNELECWLKRYAVPAMVHAWDGNEDMIRFKANGADFLMGYIKSGKQTINQRWGSIPIEQLPAEQMGEANWRRIYHDVPFRTKEEIRREVETERKSLRRGLRVIKAAFLLIIVVPVLVEIVSLGVQWLGWIISGISISAGVFKIAKKVGWIKPSHAETEEAEKKRKIEHYWYHCERNPEAFQRLKAENFRKEAAERINKEAAEIKGVHEKRIHPSDAD